MGTYIGFVGSLASILAYVFTDNKKYPFLDWLLPTVAIISLVVALSLELYTYLKNKPKKFDRQQNIDYMDRIISKGGRVVVFAGNLSWVDNDKIKKTILEKKGDLHLCVKHTAKCLDEFRNAGVHVYTYGDNDFSPTTHFTIIRQGSPNEKLAITSILDTDSKEKRYVYEISKDDKNFKDKWIVYAAEDMFELVKILNGVR